MTGANRVKYWEGRTPPAEYFLPPDPLKPIPCTFNLKKVIEYAKMVGKDITDLTREEVDIISQQVS